MIYGLIPLFLLPVFLIWVLYRLLVKKDIKKYKNEVITGFVFIGVWIVLFFVFTNI